MRQYLLFRVVLGLTFTLIVLPFASYSVVQAQVVINELGASNSSIIFDEDNEASDWIELKNTSSSAVNLEGYGLSDDADEPFKFVLPAITMPPNSFYVVFASDKNRSGGESYLETVVRRGDPTRYLVPQTNQPDAWITESFDDSNWQEGTFGVGYGDDDDETSVANGTLSIFTRTTFSVEDVNNVEKLMLHIDFDDAYIAYINGVEVHRQNINGEAPAAFNQPANQFTEPKLVYGEPLPTIFLDDHLEVLKTGENVLAIQVHNFNSGSSDLTLIPFLTIGTTVESQNSRGVDEVLNLQDNEFLFAHSNFKLSSSGEFVSLTKPDSSIADSVTYPSLLSDESYGRSLDSPDEWLIYTEPTVLAENTTNGYEGRLPMPSFNLSGGFYESDVELVLVDTSMGDHVFFTVDGSTPTSRSLAFGKESRQVAGTFTLKFRTIQAGKIPSDVLVETFFIEDKHDLPVVTVSTHPDNLWSDEQGIYVRGTNGIPGNCEGAVNWNQDWEIPIHIELYEKDGSKAFASGAGAKIFGGCSRSNPAKSLSIFFRGEYGNAQLDYKLFEEKEIDEFQAIVLRNSGNDFSSQGHTMFRDGMMKTLIEGTEIDYQAYKPAVLYLNGEYWGIHNIREKVNEHFLESNSEANSEELDLLEATGDWVIHGSSENYQEFLGFITNNDLSDPENFAVVEEMIDMDNFTDYMAAQIFYANTDWPGNNIKFWRSHKASGKWRWILYDTDFGFNLSYGGDLYHNTLSFALDPNGPGWPNPPWSTFVLRRLSTSDQFVTKFANRMADFLNTIYKPEHVHQVIDSLAGKIESEIPRHMATVNRGMSWGGSVSAWETQIDLMKWFAEYRPSKMEEFFSLPTRDRGYGLQALEEITVNVADLSQGKVKVNRVQPKTYPWSGEYFGNLKVPVKAIPKTGFTFSHWSGDSESTEAEIEINPGESVTAHFKAVTEQGNPVINEIMYNSSDELETGDWIELYNPTSSDISLNGWILKDEDDTHEFVFGEVTLAANGFVVVYQNQSEFEGVYGELETAIGELGFGLAGGSDQVRLFNADGILIDSLQYDDEDPWPANADGTGFTLELESAELDNSLPGSWVASVHQLGSPGQTNGTSVQTESISERPTEIVIYQNYPNPFNPQTTISFSLPKATPVKLRIYDVLGKHLATLVDQYFDSGVHSVTWDARNQSTGVYFYVIEIEGKRFSRKMLLLK